MGGVVPSPRFRGLKPGGINSATPHIQVSGPLRKQKVWISQGLAYRFVRSRVFDLPAGEDAAVLENFDSFTQINARLGEAHSVSTTFSLFPVEVDNFGIDTLHPAEASPDFESHGWHLAMGHRFTASPSTLIDSTFAIKSFDVAVRPEDDSLTRLTVDGLRDNYFNDIDRESRRWEANLVVSHFVREAWGAHLMKVGANVSHTRFDGIDRSQSIAVVGVDESLLRAVEFEGDGVLAGVGPGGGHLHPGRMAAVLAPGHRFRRALRLRADHRRSPRFAARRVRVFGRPGRSDDPERRVGALLRQGPPPQR